MTERVALGQRISPKEVMQGPFTPIKNIQMFVDQTIDAMDRRGVPGDLALNVTTLVITAKYDKEDDNFLIFVTCDTL